MRIERYIINKYGMCPFLWYCDYKYMRDRGHIDPETCKVISENLRTFLLDNIPNRRSVQGASDA